MKNRTYLIAEIGINHEGDYNLCKKMVKEVSICGVDAIKLQTINPDKNYTQQTKSYEIFKGSELTKKETAEIIEKHFTFDKNRPGFDHGISIDTSELKIMVERIREAEILIGSSEKTISKKIQESRDSFLRYIVASRQIDEGDIFTVSNIDIKRTSSNKPGLEPSNYNKILGMRATKKFKVDDLINI